MNEKDKRVKIINLFLILNKYKLIGIIIGNAIKRALNISVAIKTCIKIKSLLRPYHT